MAKFRIDSMGGLARQMQFTPAHTLIAQLDSAEKLLLEIDPAKGYPFDFVLFRITGYRPGRLSAEVTSPDETSADLLTGLALRHDLGLLIEQLSESLKLRADQISEPILSIDDVAERFDVTSKTIQRWRRKGLAARRLIFADGKSRIGFLLHSVERFVASHSDQVAKSANFSQVGDIERQEILRRARRLAVRCRCCRNEIARRIGRQLHRSPLTILHTIKKHDEQSPDQAIFPLAAEGLSDAERAVIVRDYRHGASIRSMARRMRRPMSAVYRAVLQDRVERLNRKKIKFVDDPLYHSPDAEQAIAAIAGQQPITASPSSEQQRIPAGLPPYLEALYRTPLLDAARERALFLEFNFHKGRFVRARRQIDMETVRHRQLDRMEQLLREAQEVKNRIVQANLRLVVSVAKRHCRPGTDLMELVSDGNLILMRAVESFDVHRGNRFSTYATLALMKGFARGRSRAKAAAFVRSDVELDRLPEVPLVTAADHVAMRQDIKTMLQRLDARERKVLIQHFGLGDSDPSTYEQIGARLGLSKQRIRQIEQIALQKLRP